MKVKKTVRLFFRVFVPYIVEGKENLPRCGGYIVAANHIGVLETVLIPAVVVDHQMAIAAKDSLFRIPVLNWILRRTGMISVKRKNPTRAEIRSVIRQAQKAMNNGMVFGIFPEGTRSRGGQLLAFRAGVGFIAVASKREVVPMGVSIRKRWLRRTYVFKIGEPINSADFRHQELTLLLRERIAELSGQKLVENVF